MVLGGDFNSVRSDEEKIGVVFNYPVMSQFSQFINDIGCMDIPLSGGRFTWCSNRLNPSYSRLDRFLISPEFMIVFQKLVQKASPRSLSDHNVVLLVVDEINWGPNPFKFFNHWTDDREFKELTHSFWMKSQLEGPNSYNIWDKFKALKLVIKEWYKKKGADDPFRISHIEEEIDCLEKRMLANQKDDTTSD